MDLEFVLLSVPDVRAALGADAHVERSRVPGPGHAIGSVLGAAAVGTAFRSFTGRVAVGDQELPLAIGTMILRFGDDRTAGETFDRVGGAAHLRTRIGECQVAVETVTAPSGLVSYWAYVYLLRNIVILTMDTLDPQRVSMSDFRQLVTGAAERLERAPRE